MKSFSPAQRGVATMVVLAITMGVASALTEGFRSVILLLLGILWLLIGVLFRWRPEKFFYKIDDEPSGEPIEPKAGQSRRLAHAIQRYDSLLPTSVGEWVFATLMLGIGSVFTAAVATADHPQYGAVFALLALSAFMIWTSLRQLRHAYSLWPRWRLLMGETYAAATLIGLLLRVVIP